MSHRSDGLPAFLAGVAAAWVASMSGHTPGNLRALMDGHIPLALAAWGVIGVIASFGAARVATQLVSSRSPQDPSMIVCGVASVLGGVAVFLLPGPWLRLLGGAGFLWMLYLAIGLLAGLADIALRIDRRSSTR